MSEETCPVFIIRDCDCEGGPRCGAIIFAMQRPVIKEVEDTGELVAIVHFPLANAQWMFDEIRRLAAKQGVKIR